MKTFVYFVLICWSFFWFVFWLWAIRNDLRLVRPGPQADLFTAVRAYSVPFVRNTFWLLPLWGWLPAAVYAANWLASE